MRHVRNDLFIHLTNTCSFKNNICLTNFTPKIIINLKIRGTRSKLPHWTILFIYTSQSRARISKLPVHDHMAYVVKIDILSGHEEMGNLHIILKIIFNCIFIEKQITCI